MSYVPHVLGLYIGIQLFCFFVEARFFIGPFDNLRKDLLQVDNSILRCLHTVVSQILVLGSGVKRAAFGQKIDRKSTRLNSSHVKISYAVFCLKKKKTRLIHGATT